MELHMNGREKPWHGVLVATPTFFRDDLSVDFDRYGEHVRWLVDSGCDGVCPNGSLGEYQSLTPDERAQVVRTAVDAVGGDRVMPGVGAYGAGESRRWAEQAAEAGAASVLLLPPNAYRADARIVAAHYAEVAKAGLPIVAYNNPHDTKVDLTPDLLAELGQIENVVAVKEFSGDVRRVLEIRAAAPHLTVVAGADDVVLESLLMGATGWFAGYPNVFPAECTELFELAQLGKLNEARALYERLVPAFRWDSRTEFVQAIKHSMDFVGRYGGPCRPPRGPLSPEQRAQVDADMKLATRKLDTV
jgi:4-hydroxy-tetrahydrodipicolinate synthase